MTGLIRQMIWPALILNSVVATAANADLKEPKPLRYYESEETYRNLPYACVRLGDKVATAFEKYNARKLKEPDRKKNFLFPASMECTLGEREGQFQVFLMFASSLEDYRAIHTGPGVFGQTDDFGVTFKWGFWGDQE